MGCNGACSLLLSSIAGAPFVAPSTTGLCFSQNLALVVRWLGVVERRRGMACGGRCCIRVGRVVAK